MLLDVFRYFQTTASLHAVDPQRVSCNNRHLYNLRTSWHAAFLKKSLTIIGAHQLHWSLLKTEWWPQSREVRRKLLTSTSSRSRRTWLSWDFSHLLVNA